MRIRVGMGYDVHRLVEGRDLWLGGIKLEHTMGLLGHSDADVLIHAICDAMLGAANMRDIGFHFPDTYYAPILNSTFRTSTSQEKLSVRWNSTTPYIAGPYAFLTKQQLNR